MSGDVDVRFAAATGCRRGGGVVSCGTVDGGQALDLGARYQRPTGNLDELDLTGLCQLVKRRPTDAELVAPLIDRIGGAWECSVLLSHVSHRCCYIVHGSPQIGAVVR